MNEQIKNIRALAKNILTEQEINFSELLIQELQTISLDIDSLNIAYLLSIKELTNDKIKYIKDNFNETILSKIELFRRISSINVPTGSKLIMALRNIFIELTDDLKLIIIKLYERTVTLKIANKANSEDLFQLAEQCLGLYAPIAHRLGIRQIYNQIEDIAFKVLYHDDFVKLDIAIEKKRNFLENKLKSMAEIVREQLAKNNIEADIQYRVKRPYSIFKKLQNKSIEIDQIFDLMALRIITKNIDDCYLCLGIAHRNWIPIENRFRDWVTFPKPNGYRSIQTTVITNSGDKFEIQIRTEQMHKEAEFGSAAHWAYKEKTSTDDSWIARLKEFLENDEYFSNPSALDDLLKSEAKRNYIHILTPKGEVKTLSEGSSLLDFAFSIHSDVFLHCTGGRVNNKFVKLKSELKTGDVVEVITNKNAKPSRDWLEFLKSTSARSKLIQWIKKNETEQLLSDGKRSWERFKKTNRHKIASFEDESVFKQNLTKIGYKSPDDFYSAIGINSLKLSLTLLRKLYPLAFEHKKREIKQLDRKQKSLKDMQINVEGLTNIETKLAKCCNPIKGEPIIAYITQKTGIKVHSQHCVYFLNGLLDESRLKPAVWSDKSNTQSIKVRVFGVDYNKIFTAAVESAQSDKISILSTEKKPLSKQFDCLEIELEIKDIEQYNHYIAKLKKYGFIKSIK
jgi:GTP diphosphokinase / guanosine-3',5'-bis(diphosphate) 3'-diphosphatase